MKSLICISGVFLALIVVSYGHPREKREACPEGESYNAVGLCEKIAVESFPVTETVGEVQTRTEQKAKKAKAKNTKKRQLKRKLDEEIKDIKRLVLEGIERGTVEITCPDGQKLNAEGVCDEPATGNVETTPKTKKQLALEKKLEKELQLVLKKEIQNDIRRKRKKEKKLAKKNAEKAAAGNAAPASAPAPANADAGSQKDQLPFCDDKSPAGATDCKPKS